MLAEWIEYDRLEPFGAWRDNWHMAVLTSIVANANRDPKKRPTPFSPSEFFYRDAETQQRDADLETVAWFEALASKPDGS